MENPYINSQFFQKLETRAITARKNLEAFYSGKHQTNKYGQTVEFSEHKEYVVGDDLRKIDWNLYSRFNQYYIKYYKDEQQIQINIYLDISKHINTNNAESNAFNHTYPLSIEFSDWTPNKCSIISCSIACDSLVDSLKFHLSFTALATSLVTFPWKSSLQINELILGLPPNNELT